MRIRIYISVILILIQKSTSEAVSRPSPPVNVSIQCDSYGVEVRWEYPDLSKDVDFIVVVQDREERKNYRTPNLNLNISTMLVPSKTKVHFVNVTAVRGGQMSDSCESDTFSFNELATAKIKCYLDFPEVELSPKDGKLHIQFINPLELYRDTPALRNLNNQRDLDYTVKAEEHVNKTTCHAKAKTCETSIEFSKHTGVYCVDLTGKIEGGRKLNLRSSCFTGDIRIYASFTMYLFTVLGVVLSLLFLTVIIILLVRKFTSEIKKKSIDAFHKLAVFKPIQTHLREPLKLSPEVVASDLHIEPKEQTTLLEMCSDEVPNSGDEDVGSKDSNSESLYRGNDLDEADLGDSTIGYDCPHRPHGVRVEMSPGDMVKGYGP